MKGPREDGARPQEGTSLRLWIIIVSGWRFYPCCPCNWRESRTIWGPGIGADISKARTRDTLEHACWSRKSRACLERETYACRGQEGTFLFFSCEQAVLLRTELEEMNAKGIVCLTRALIASFTLHGRWGPLSRGDL